MNRLLRQITTLLFWLFALTCAPTTVSHLSHRQFRYTHLGTSNGLSSSRIYSILQAKDNAMWIGTKNGIERYNGSVVKSYEWPSDMPISDGGGHIIQLTQDIQGNIYSYDNKRKIAKYNPVIDKFEQLYDLSNILNRYAVTNYLYIDINGTMWIGCSNGLFRLNSNKAGQWVIKNCIVNHICSYGNDILVATNDGVLEINIHTNQYKYILQGTSVQTIYHDKITNHIWLGLFYGGAKIIDDKTYKEIQANCLKSLPQNPIRSITRLNNSTIVLGIDGAGVYATENNGSEAWVLFDADERSDNALQGNGIYDLCLDNNGNLWIGSYTGGVNICYPYAHVLEEINHKHNNSQSLINDNVNSVMESIDGTIWYATDRGVSIYNPNTGIWKQSLHNKVVLTLCQGDGNQVLAGTYGNGIYAINIDGKCNPAYTKENGVLHTNYVFQILRDDSGDLWIGCLDGDLVHICKGKNNYYPIQQVQNLALIPDKKVAVGTSNGFYIIDKATKTYKSYFQYKENSDKTDINHFIQSLLFQDRNLVWIATDGGGLYLYDITNNSILKHISINQGLPSNTIYTLGKDKDSRLIASTDRGLGIIDIKTGKVINVNFIDGLNREYKRISMTQLRDGRFILGSSTGAIIIWPEKIQQLSYNTSLNIKGIKVNGEDNNLAKSLYEMLNKGEIELSYEQNTFSIDFESIYYKYQHDIVYQFRLNEFDPDWSIPSPAQQANYTNLPPGNYEFYVRSISKNDGKILCEKKIIIKVSQPWWNCWLAWCIYITIIVVLVYLIWTNYRDRLQQRYFDEKLNFFTHTAHDLRTPLSLVLSPLNDIAEDPSLSTKNREFLLMAKKNGEKLLNMFTQLLDFQRSDRTMSIMHVQEYNLKNILNEQIQKFYPMAIQKQQQLKLEECPEDQSIWLDYSMTENIFENLLSNAIKYTPQGGLITINATNDNRKIYIRITDTGIGIPQHEQKYIFQSFYRAQNAVNTHQMGSGLGLMLTSRLVKRHHGKLTFQSIENKGTSFLLTFPKGHKHFAEDCINETPQYDNSKENCKEGMVSVSQDNMDNRDTLLFIDDNEELRNYINLTFESYYNVITLSNAQQAIDFIHQGNLCDIVVSDIMMPGMHGDELCHHIKEDEETAWLPVILLTGKSNRNDILQGLGKGADDYLTKPFDSAVLRSKIDNILQNRRRLSNYYMKHLLNIVKQDNSDDNIESDTDPNNFVSDKDRLFVEKATHTVMDHITDPEFDIDKLCREMAMSRTALYGRIKSLTAQTPQEFIRIIRLERAASLLRQGETVIDVSINTGFVNAKYFSTVFKKHFGISPSKYK